MIRTTLRVGCVIALVATIVTPSPARAQLNAFDGQPANLSEVPLMPGDAIQLRFWREPELNGEYSIDESGRVVLPVLGVRYVAGAAPAELIEQLQVGYDRELNNQEVGITLLRRVRILGAVRTPGLYHVNATMTLGDALALAGGARADGKLSHVTIRRDKSEMRVNLRQNSLLALDIRSGDQIWVPERSWFSRHSRVVVGGLLSAAVVITTRIIMVK